MGTQIDVARLYRFDGEGNLKAFADVTVGGELLVKGLRIVSGKKGIFVAMPSAQGKDGRWYEIIKPLSDELRAAMSEVVLQAYQEPHE